LLGIGDATSFSEVRQNPFGDAIRGATGVAESASF
jgi:hypothetical protein